MLVSDSCNIFDETTKLGQYERYQYWDSLGYLQTKEEKNSERDRF